MIMEKVLLTLTPIKLAENTLVNKPHHPFVMTGMYCPVTQEQMMAPYHITSN